KARIFVAGGFVEVTAERCTVLAEEALPLEDIDRSQVEKDLQEATEDISDAGDNAVERALAEQRADTARAKLASLDSQIYQ
ncbi:MAG: F0F1 ATP synthase subunit epsilon, partial [Alphaproteobacteria bacterium]